ncbi:MAG: insulinase family protein [Acidobacteria bacterium]|nr:insulinase family protein [Acidobacteriota bacterium]
MKRHIVTIFLAALMILGSASVVAAQHVDRPHPRDLIYPPLRVKTPEVSEISLNCGLDGFLLEDHEIPVVNVVLLVKTYYPERSKYGLNDMAQWVMRNGGSQRWPAEKLNDELEFLAADIEVFGGDLSTMVVLNCLKKDLPTVLDIFADLVMNPAFPADKVEMRRQTMLEELRRQNDQPRQVANREFNKLIYGDHLYGWDTSPASVQAITREDLLAFHQQYFHPNNAIIGISGDVEQAEIMASLDKAFAQWPAADVVIPEIPALSESFNANHNYAFMDINQAYMMLGHQGLNANNPDRCAVNVMNFILGGGSFTSWITERVRSDEGLAYSTGSRFGADPFAKGTFYAFAQTKADAYSRAMQLMIEQMDRMRTDGPTEEEVRKAVDSYLNSQVFDYESKAQVIQRLVSLRFEGRPLDTPQRDMEAYAKLTAADIRRVAQKYLHPDKLTVLVVGNEKLFDRPLSDFGKVNVIDLKTE